MATRAVQECLRRVFISNRRNQYQEIVSKFIEELSQEKWRIKAITVIEGLNFEEDKIKLSGRSNIEKMDLSDRELLINNTNSSSIPSYLHRHLRSQEEFYILRTTVKKDVSGGLESIEDILTSDNNIQILQNERDILENTLKLQVRERFRLGTMFFFDKTMNKKLSVIETDSTRNQSHIAARETAEHDITQSIIDTFQLLKEYEGDDEGLKIALGRYSSTLDKLENTDTLIDCFIGLEALLSANENDSLSQIIERIAYVIGDYSAYEMMSSFKDKRNKVVHGSEVKFKKSEMDKIRKITADTILEVLEEKVDNQVSSREQAQNVDKEFIEFLRDK